LANLKSGDWEFLLTRKLLVALKKEFGGGDNKSIKVAELK